MDNPKFITLLRKEWKELTRDRHLLVSFLISLGGLSLFLMFLLKTATASEVKASAFLAQDPGVVRLLTHLDPIGRASEYVGYVSRMLFLWIILVFSSLLGAESYVGEKERNTLETLLSQPLTSTDIVLGKSLAPAAISCLGAWSAALLTLFLSKQVGGPGFLGGFHGATIYALLLVPGGICMALAGASSAVLVSVWVNSTRAGYVVSTLTSALLGSLLLPLARISLTGLPATVLVVLILAAVAALALGAATATLQRNLILRKD